MAFESIELAIPRGGLVGSQVAQMSVPTLPTLTHGCSDSCTCTDCTTGDGCTPWETQYLCTVNTPCC